jgi:chitinase
MGGLRNRPLACRASAGWTAPLLALLVLVLPGDGDAARHKLFALATSVVGSGTVSPPPAPPPPGARRDLVGYFTQWGVYGRGYHVRDVARSGAAERLTVLEYAFAGIDAGLRCASLDPWADFQRPFEAAESVDGVADGPDQTLRGNFNQLRKLRQRFPRLRVVIAIGGWNHSQRFSDAALPANRAAFARSCVDMFIRGAFAPGVSGPGIFDGIELDWEYPGRCGATCEYRPEDGENLSALLAELRAQLDAIDPALILTLAAPATSYHSSQLQLERIPAHLDWINLMTYDYHGWEATGPTHHHAPLFSSPADPSGGGSVDRTVAEYLARGVPVEKLVLGIPAYGRGWEGVGPANDGLYQPAAGLASGSWESGVEDFAVLQSLGHPSFWDPLSQARWLYDGSRLWSYDDPGSAAAKAAYARERGLRGALLWELSGDDAEGSLIRAIAGALQSR